MSDVPWTRAERWAVAGLAATLAVTAVWWALALWPVAPGAAPWLERTRQVCFGSTETGLPDAGGWLLLIGQPLSMVVTLVVVWGRALRGGLWALSRTGSGRVALALTLAAGSFGALGAGLRVSDALDVSVNLTGAPLQPDSYPVLDRPAPPLDLVDQHGQRFALERFRGRPVVVTFAFGHCTTLCPMTVYNAREAARAFRERNPALVVVTLDPWRDTPSRLPHLASRWELDRDQFVLSGPVDDVERVLESWDVARERDLRTGDVAHPPLVYLVDGRGRIAYATPGDPQLTAALGLRLTL